MWTHHAMHVVGMNAKMTIYCHMRWDEYGATLNESRAVWDASCFQNDFHKYWATEML
jgi:hypothetical protein